MMIRLPIMFYVLQWNARSLTSNGKELKRFVNAFVEKPELISIQEKWLKPRLSSVIPGYECERADRLNKSRGGCAHLIH